MLKYCLKKLGDVLMLVLPSAASYFFLVVLPASFPEEALLLSFYCGTIEYYSFSQIITYFSYWQLK